MGASLPANDEGQNLKAIYVTDLGGPEGLGLREWPNPDIRPHDLIVEVRAAGVNRADLSYRKGAYGRANFGDSDLMGLEIAGDVVELGNQVRGFAEGDRVMGIVGGGAYAERARIDYRMAMRIPETLDYVQAAAVPEAFITAHECLFHLGRLERDESVLIHAAASGVGSAAVQLAHVAEATVYATAGGAKLERVRQLGADVTIPYKTDDFARAITEASEGRGVDVIVDFIGAANFERNFTCLAAGGRLIQAGLLGGFENTQLPLDRLVHRHIQVIGTIMKSRSEEAKFAMTRRFRERWLDALKAEVVRPLIDSVFSFSQVAHAHRRLEDRANVGKVILTP
jgi:putative PIG3 family NAD(P)H quinone oxidoreductase